LLKSNLKSLNDYSKDTKKIIDERVQELVLVSAATQSDDLKTANANAIIPDFGLINSYGHNTHHFLFPPC